MLEGQLLILTIVSGLISIVLFLIAIFRISGSKLSDGMKFGWIIAILLFPIAGSICALVIVKKEPLKVELN